MSWLFVLPSLFLHVCPITTLIAILFRQEHGVIAEVVRAVRKGDVEMVKVVCVALRVDDLKEVLRELGGPISGSRALLLERILCHVPGYKRAALDPREALGTGAGRRPVLATPRQLIPADAETLVLTSKNDPSDGERGAPTFALPAMEGKDLLTGEKLPKKSLQVSRANDAFYDAYESANIRAMSRVWGKAPHVKCCQPGRRFVIGYKEVMDSWKELFASQKDQWPSKISVTEIRVVTASDIAWVTCLETLDQGQGAEAAQVLSTNIFRAQQTGASKARTRWLLECRASSRLIPGL